MSFSQKAGTVRGLHYQAPPHGQAKLVSCLAGRILDVAVDIRPGSPTLGRWVSRELTAEEGNQIYVPSGFAHGFSTLECDCIVSYKVSAPYKRSAERAIAFDDPHLAIDWPVTRERAILSEKDRNAMDFQTALRELGARP